MRNQTNLYQKTSVETADRGRLILLVYDHCIKWCNIAKEAIQNNQSMDRTKALFKVQDGITELNCALDMEKGGEIARNLHRLYTFFGSHLTEANIKNNSQNVEEVLTMLQSLREAWSLAITDLRTSRDSTIKTAAQRNMISMVG